MIFIDGINSFVDGLWAAAGVGGLGIVIAYPFYLIYQKVSNK